MLTDPERKNLEADNVSITLGPSSGYVIQFTNGLKVYLSGDTGLHADMKSIVNEFHKANLAVLNLGPSAVTGFSAAYAVNELLKPATVIASHVNEGATIGGKVTAGFPHRRIHEPGQGPPRASRVERQDDGVRRRRQVRGRLLTAVRRGRCRGNAGTGNLTSPARRLAAKVGSRVRRAPRFAAPAARRAMALVSAQDPPTGRIKARSSKPTIRQCSWPRSSPEPTATLWTLP